jgi:hypothetical protein
MTPNPTPDGVIFTTPELLPEATVASTPSQINTVSSNPQRLTPQGLP